jgi:hypothetical protein
MGKYFTTTGAPGTGLEALLQKTRHILKLVTVFRDYLFTYLLDGAESFLGS